MVMLLISSRFIEKARQGQQTPYSLPAWDKDLPTLDAQNEGPEAEERQVELPREQN